MKSDLQTGRQLQGGEVTAIFFCKNLGAKKGAWLVSHSKCIAITQHQYFSNNHEYSKGAYKIKIFCCERRSLEIKGINIIYYYKPYDRWPFNKGINVQDIYKIYWKYVYYCYYYY